jgi:Uma2 family endonuclease
MSAPPEVDYPESDGLPMADNTVQYEWIVTIKGGLDALFGDDPDVFVAGNLFWYPVEGDNRTVLAPDTLVAFGRPKDGRRGSYRQWEEGGIAPQVVFEVRSPNNDNREMLAKRAFYERFGVEEYYEFDPDAEPVTLRGWIRQGQSFAEIRETSGWTSPRLGIRFELGDDLTIFRPDGRPFETFRELQRRAELAERNAKQAERNAEQAERNAEQAERRFDEERLRAERLAAKLRALGLDPDE